jgi:hypothetical protein
MIEKSTFTRNGDTLSVGLMFTKIDTENRTVSGFATLDNVDGHGDIVSAVGSASAFQRFRGGIREMHTNNAVGTLLSFEETKKYDMDTDKVYDGIFVTAKISKGAPDTWEKVLDGTLKGFSIGGKVTKKSPLMGDDGSEHMYIEEYDLIELSLVDNPANPLANVLTVTKVGDTFVFTDDLIEKQVLSILMHPETGDVILSEDAERDGFENIGYTDSPHNTEKIRLALANYKTSKTEEIIQQADTAETEKIAGDDTTTTEGGATVATENNTEAVEDVTVEKAADEVETVEETVAADETLEVEKAADVQEIAEEVEPTVESTDDIVTKVMEAVTAAMTKATEAAEESKDAVTSIQSSFEKAFETVSEQVSSIENTLNDELGKLAKRLSALEGGTAVKKSADVVVETVEDEDEDEDNFWRGQFLNANSLIR